MCGSWAQNDGMALTEGLWDMGEGIILAKDLHNWVEDILFTCILFNDAFWVTHINFFIYL
jgi:hypothetical protein